MTDEPEEDVGITDVLHSAAEDLAGIQSRTFDGVITWSIGDLAFATLAGDRAEFRLDPLVARAALRTPDTAASPRGPDWVAFAPSVLDEGAVDRAEAWFLSAHRRATRSPR